MSIKKTTKTQIGSVIPKGTSGSVLFIDSNAKLAQDNTNLFWDDSNNRLGIGTPTPAVELDIVGTINASVNANITGDLDVDGITNLDATLVDDIFSQSVTNPAAGGAVMTTSQNVAAVVKAALASQVMTQHTVGSIVLPIGYFGGVLIDSAGAVTQAEGVRGTAEVSNTETPTVVLMKGAVGVVDVNDATVTSAMSVFGENPTVDTGSIANSWAGYFNGDVQLSSDMKLILEGSTASKGDTYFLFDSAGATLDTFVNGVEVMNASSTTLNIKKDIEVDNAEFLVMDKASGNGIKVDTTTPTFGFADILGDQFSKNVGATKPTLTTYNGVVQSFQFGAGDEAYISYHIPHDYVKGTDLFLHIHWSHIGTLVTGGTVTFKATSVYAKGHNQAAFQSTPSVGTFTGTASTTQFQHILSETQFSASSPTGIQIDTDDLEPDGVVEMTFEVDANNITVSSGGVPDPFIHFVDLHYQTTGLIGTKDKVPDFYA